MISSAILRGRTGMMRIADKLSTKSEYALMRRKFIEQYEKRVM